MRYDVGASNKTLHQSNIFIALKIRWHVHSHFGKARGVVPLCQWREGERARMVLSVVLLVSHAHTGTSRTMAHTHTSSKRTSLPPDMRLLPATCEYTRDVMGFGIYVGCY